MWAERTAARLTREVLGRGCDEGTTREELLAVWLWRARSPTGVVATFVAYLRECLTTVDLALLPAAPDGAERDLRLGLSAECTPGNAVIDLAHHEGLGPAKRVLLFGLPGLTDEPDDAIASMRCLWRVDELTDLLVTVVAPDTGLLLEFLPAIDALLDTLAVCTAPATPPGHERALLRLLHDVTATSPANQDPNRAHVGTPGSP